MTGSSLGFPTVWLRHNCRCPECLDPVTGQRLIEVTAIPNGCGVTVEAQTAESVTLVFAPDGHRGVFSRAWLAAHTLPADDPAPARRSPWLSGLAGVPAPPAAPGPAAPGFAAGFAAGGGTLAGEDADPRAEDGKRLWLAADLAAILPSPPGSDPPPAGGATARAEGPGPIQLPAADWDSYLADDAVRAACLDAVATLGFALLRGVPAKPGTVLRVAKTFGFVRRTNYGKLFDVRVVADPANLAFTSRAIPPHTDNPYRDPVPTLQLLHCLRDASLGGDTGLVDGFAAAAALRREDPASFALLTATPWPFGYSDTETELRARAPLIALTPDGRITAVRLNNRSMGPLRLPYAQAEAAYAAYRAWASLLGRPEFRLTMRLAPGDCVIFDNTRVLHARTAFTAPAAGQAGSAAENVAEGEATADGVTAGAVAEGAPGAQPVRERHLQGCYADIDGLLSTLAVLRRGSPPASRSLGTSATA
jgi:gamma-butyrobetaine dioxygenase